MLGIKGGVVVLSTGYVVHPGIVVIAWESVVGKIDVVITVGNKILE